MGYSGKKKLHIPQMEGTFQCMGQELHSSLETEVC